MLEIDLRAVSSAANGLANEGKRVSVRRVRERLGGRGSQTTIARHLRAWKRGEQPEPEVQRPHVPGPFAALEQRLDRIEDMLGHVIKTLAALRKPKTEPKTKTPTAETPPPRPAITPGLPETLPDNIEDLRRVAVAFVAGFSGARKPETAENYVPQYIRALASCRRQGATTAIAWEAFCDELENRRKPLFSGAMAALSHLPKYKEMQEQSRRTVTRSEGRREAG